MKRHPYKRISFLATQSFGEKETSLCWTFEGPMGDMIHVLLVDDDEACLRLISSSLRLGGFEVAIARSGEEALEQLEARKPELIVSDVMMPGMNGYELCRQVRLRGYEDIPFLFLSALGSPPERVVGLRMGADDYIVKPVNEEELLLKVGRQVKKAGKLRSLKEQAERKYPSSTS